MRSLYILWSAFFDICRLRLGPQDLPASSVLLGLSLSFYVVINVIVLWMQFPVGQAILLTVVETGLFVILISSLLYFVHYSARIYQTLTALAGINGVFGILTIPLIFWIEFYDNNVGLPVLLFLGLIVWNLLVFAHILRHALVVSLFMGMVLTIIIHSLTFSIVNQLFLVTP